MPLRILFLCSLIIGLVVQGSLWRHVRVIDQNHWVKRIESITKSDFSLFREPMFANPNAPMLWIGAAAHTFGVPSIPSMYGSMSILISLAIAGIVTMAYRLRPDIPWWIAAGIIMLSHHLYIRSAPQDAIVAPLIVLTMLLLLKLRKHPIAYADIVVLGLVQGAALATRVEISSLWILGALAYMFTFLRRRKIVLIILCTMASVFIFDPFLWFMPITHIQAMFTQVSQHMSSIERPETAIRSFIYFAPHAFISMVFALIYMIRPTHHTSPIPRSYFAFLFAMTIIIPSLIFQARFNTFRYFYSLIMVWDVLLPLFLLHGISLMRVQEQSPAFQRTFRKVFQYAVVAFFIVAFPLMQFYIYYLPAKTVSIDWSQFTFSHAQDH